MSRNEPERVNEHHLPALTAPAAPRPSLARSAPKSAFISQLIAERYRLAPQRLKRQVPLNIAVETYRTGSTIAVRRLPAGFRTTLVV